MAAELQNLHSFCRIKSIIPKTCGMLFKKFTKTLKNQEAKVTSYYIGYDCGTMGTKVAIYSLEGELISEAYQGTCNKISETFMGRNGTAAVL